MDNTFSEIRSLLQSTELLHACGRVADTTTASKLEHPLRIEGSRTARRKILSLLKESNSNLTVTGP